jgi:hypothetical protein
LHNPLVEQINKIYQNEKCTCPLIQPFSPLLTIYNIEDKYPPHMYIRVEVQSYHLLSIGRRVSVKATVTKFVLEHVRIISFRLLSEYVENPLNIEPLTSGTHLIIMNRKAKF